MKDQMLMKEQKFKQLIEQNRDRIRRICQYYAPRAEDQYDMYQEVLVNIWKSLDSFRGESAISTWIYRIAVNTSLSYAGKELQRLRLNVSGEHNFQMVFSIDGESAAREKEVQFGEMEMALNQLSVVDKLLISLMLEQLSMREISDIVGITEANVRVKIHRIKETLRNKLMGDTHE